MQCSKIDFFLRGTYFEENANGSEECEDADGRQLEQFATAIQKKMFWFEHT